MNNNINQKRSLRCFVSVVLFFTMAFAFVVPNRTLMEPVLASSELDQMKDSGPAPRIDRSFGNTPVYFERNEGQFHKRVKYFARGTKGYSLFLTGTEAVYVLREVKAEEERPRMDRHEIDRLAEARKTENEPRMATSVHMRLAGANENAIANGLEQLPHKTNYFKGKESNWRTEIPNFRQVRMKEIYAGVDAVWKGRQGGAVQYDFIVKPNADPNLIEWEIEGADSVTISGAGELVIKTEFGDIKQQKPFTYQEGADGLRQEIESNFKIVSTRDERRPMNRHRVKFEIGNYDRSKSLIIDPTVRLSNLSFSTFLGGENSERGNDVATDRAGNVYVAGETLSQSFPTTSGTFDTTPNGSTDAFVAKFNASGSDLIYSTFIGGNGLDRGLGIAVDSSGNAFITGGTFDGTTDYPTTSGAFDEVHNGVDDVFVTKLDPNGSSLVYSTLLGGSSQDFGNDIAVDASGNAFITGLTNPATTGYPTTPGAYDVTPNGAIDSFVTKLSTTGSSLSYSTLLGGNASDTANGIDIDSAGNAYVTGETFSANFPTTIVAHDTTFNGTTDVFVTKFNASGSGIFYSTYIGGNSIDSGNGIAVDSVGNAFIVGETSSANFPTTIGAFDTSSNGVSDAFVTKLSASGGSTLLFSTFIGGSGDDGASSIDIDSSGNAFITGYTNDAATDYPTTSGAYDTTHNGGDDAFVTRLNSAGSNLVYSTYIGGNNSDEGYGIAIDPSGNAFITGETFSTDYPNSPEAFQGHNNGSFDVFVTKLGDFSISGRTLDTTGDPLANTAVSMSGNTSGFMLSDADGYFYFGNTSTFGGTHIVTAIQTLYNFTPPTYEVSMNHNKELNFVGRPTSSGPTAAPASLGGNVRSVAGNVGLPNTRLTLFDVVSGDVTVANTDANGNYEFEDIATGSFYVVIPDREGYDFMPGIYEVNHFDENLGLNFTASPNSPRPVNDFDGDGKTDLAVFRPESGIWYILNSQDDSVTIRQFGLTGNVPVAADYDGDGRADIAVYRPAEGIWYRLDSTDGEFHAVRFGLAGDTPVQADFDGDGRTDLAVYRPSSGDWHRLLSSDGSYVVTKFGIETDIPVAADHDADGKADLAVYRDGIWYRMRSSDGQIEIFQFGLPQDKPVKADFDGDGKSDTGVFRPSTGVWYWIDSTDGEIHARQFGIETDIPITADHNGDGRFEHSVFRDGIWYVLRPDNSYYAAQFGQAGDIPIR